MKQVQIIKSKLIPPMPSSTYMRRSSFIKKMYTASEYPLTILQGGAGYGKSLGLAQFFRDSKNPYSWYTITSEDDSIIPFISYLSSSIQQEISSFGKTFKHFLSPTTFLREADLQQWIGLFINELFEIQDDFTIIMDDFHLVDHVFEINYTLEKIITLLPPHIHLIIATRSKPKWTNLVKFRMEKQLFELGKEDLVFSEDETIVYLEDYFDLKVTEGQIKEIVTVTEGWPIAINLMALQLSDADEAFSRLMQPVFANVFDYLSEEVFKRWTENEQEWLLLFAIFPTFSKQLIEEFYQTEGVHTLQQFIDRHGFIQSLGEDGTYRFHALFQRFLTNKWLELDRVKFMQLHKKATQYYDDKGNFVQATYHASQSRDHHFLSKTLVKTAQQLIESGQFDWFLELYEPLDEFNKNQFFTLYFYEGEVHRYRAFYKEARNAYEKCVELATENDDSYYLSRSYAGIAHIFLDTIQPAYAESYLKKAIQWSQKSKKMKLKEKNLLKRQFAENLVNLGRANDAKNWVESEKLPESILKEGNLEARILLRMGKLVDAKHVLHESIYEHTVLPESHRETEVLLSLINGMMGELDAAINNAHKGIEIGRQVNSRFIEAVAFTRSAIAKSVANPFMLMEAEEDFYYAIDMMEKMNVSRVQAEPYMGLAILKAKKGLIHEAINDGQFALRETEKVHDDWMTALIRLSLAIIYFYYHDYNFCRYHLLKAKRNFRISGDLYGEMVTSFWLMQVYAKVKNSRKLKFVARRFSKICIEENYLFFLKKDTIFGPFDRQCIYPLLSEVHTYLPNDHYMEKINHELELTQFVHHPGYAIYVNLLGPFQLKLGLHKVKNNVWKREKAKELLTYFLIHRDRFIRKEEILQSLWGDVDKKTADRNFKVTMNALLKVLEPERQARDQSFFIIRNNTMYRFNPDAVVVSDIDLFNQLALSELRGNNNQLNINYLLKRIEFYQGAPFEELMGVEWVNQEQERIIEKYLQLIERLAFLYLNQAEYQEVIEWAEKIIKIDKTWEEAYRLIMLAYQHMQKRSQAIRWYKKCSEALHEELNITPSESTNELYDMLINPE